MRGSVSTRDPRFQDMVRAKDKGVGTFVARSSDVGAGHGNGPYARMLAGARLDGVEGFGVLVHWHPGWSPVGAGVVRRRVAPAPDGSDDYEMAVTVRSSGGMYTRGVAAVVVRAMLAAGADVRRLIARQAGSGSL